MLTLKHTQNICLLGVAGRECRYLSQGCACVGNECLKQSEYKDRIDHEVGLFLESGSNLKLPVGDNCKGYPQLKIKQGYNTGWNYLRRWYIELKLFLRNRHDNNRQNH
jgi:hypothetical protein